MKILLIFSLYLISAAAGGSRTVRGFSGGGVLIKCRYDTQYTSNKKYFCKSLTLTCADQIKTDVKNAWVNSGRFSLFDNTSAAFFSVMITNLTVEDYGTYQCAVDVTQSLDLYTPMELNVEEVSDYNRIISVTGHAGGSVNISCKYPEFFRGYPKFLCRRVDSVGCVYKTPVKESGKWINQEKYALHDDVKNTLSVIISDVREGDSGELWCGAELDWESDNGYKLYITHINLTVTVPTCDKANTIYTKAGEGKLLSLFVSSCESLRNHTAPQISGEYLLQDLMKISDEVVSSGNINDSFTLSAFLGAMEDTLHLIGPQLDSSVTRVENNISETYIAVKKNVTPPTGHVILSTNAVHLNISWKTVVGKSYPGFAYMGIISYKTLNTSVLEETNTGGRTTDYNLNSPIVTVFVSNKNTEHLPEPVTLTFKHNQEVVSESKPSCVSWSNTKWTKDGCKLIHSNINHSVCSCDHLSTFALIMRIGQCPYDENNTVMMVIGILALSVGIVFLTLSLVTFVNFQRNPRLTNTALINLCLTLLLAHLLFLLTQIFLHYIKPLQVLCAVLAVVLHFFFLSAFVWMFIEAVMLFIHVKNLTKLRSKKEGLKWKYLVLTGYIIPLIVVGVSAGLVPKGYGSEQCWLKKDKDFVWSFLGPVCFILAANTLLFLSILIIMTSTLKKMTKENLKTRHTERDQQLFKSVVLKTMIQFFILGCSWVPGFFTGCSKVLEIMFLLLNSQQGTFIFLIHCVFNQEVRLLYVKWWRNLRANRTPKTEVLVSGVIRPQMNKVTVWTQNVVMFCQFQGRAVMVQVYQSDSRHFLGEKS
ncbi:adhesion G protein-coupled receptor E3-like [Hoplias malabaricus]|uniref:adhesion G protein-coupled receptor E3-like n=1 Tax=Hoplias malabaricus TaxID=27720 RepID=UPI003461AED2